MKKYLPIRIFSIKYAYGWWWGKYFFFFGKHSTAFAIIPMCNHLHQCEYMNGKAIEDGDTLSWSPERQREKQEKRQGVQELRGVSARMAKGFEER